MIHPSPRSRRRKQILRVGLLGGSFNPAHKGHLAISLYALKNLGLHQIWWLVSPQNPLKVKNGMAPLPQRLRYARRLAGGRARIRVTAIEKKLGTRYTIDTLLALQRLHPETRFVWLMGADNLLAFDRWRRWKDIFRQVPIAVFRRPGYAVARHPGKAARAFAKARMKPSMAGMLVLQTPPAWLVLANEPHALSATKLRQKRAKKQRQTKGSRDVATKKKKANRKIGNKRAAKKSVSQKKRTPGKTAAKKTIRKSPAKKRAEGLPEKLKKAALKVLDERQAENVVTVDLRNKSALADYALIASGRSSRQAAAIADYLHKAFVSLGVRKIRIEGLPQGDWVLVDAGDVIVHVFRPEVRRYYNLEDIWSHKPRGA